jgi:hypothetical protein
MGSKQLEGQKGVYIKHLRRVDGKKNSFAGSNKTFFSV